MALRYAIAMATLIMAGVPSAYAQTTDGASTMLARRIRAGDRVWVETPNALQKGRVIDLSGETLRLRTDGQDYDIPVRRIVTVERKRNGVVLGTLIGAGVGFGLGLPLASLVHNEGGSAAGAIVSMTALGAGAGAGLDALLSVRRTVYRRGEARIRISPTIASNRVAVFVSKQF